MTDWLPPWLRRRLNPRNLTRQHLDALVQRHGFSIGDHSYGAPKVRFAEGGGGLTIGKYCSIADQVEIFLGGNHRSDFVTTYPFGSFRKDWPDAQDLPSPARGRGDVIIGHDVWIGFGALILSGVRIGNGAVIGARSVVSRDVPAYTIVAGSPARVLRPRFSPGFIEQLQEVAWWDLPDKSVGKLARVLQSDRIEVAIEAIRTERARLNLAG
ncbi:MAG TPA: CatB-related O-acetyltransferase [Beijerinckiaceae bacterium]|nr:CatB-related O-acetyltransferase [Beijerinckiaceae bacterium]